MALSWHEMAAVAIGLAGGYWLVSRVLEGREDTGAQRPGASSAPPSGDGRKPWWEVLGVPRNATRDEISLAYKRRISDYHPDKVAQMGDEIRAVAERMTKEINAAYDEALRSL